VSISLLPCTGVLFSLWDHLGKNTLDLGYNKPASLVSLPLRKLPTPTTLTPTATPAVATGVTERQTTATAAELHGRVAPGQAHGTRVVDGVLPPPAIHLADQCPLARGSWCGG